MEAFIDYLAEDVVWDRYTASSGHPTFNGTAEISIRIVCLIKSLSELHRRKSGLGFEEPAERLGVLKT